MRTKPTVLEGTMEDIWSIRIYRGESPLKIDTSKNAFVASITKDDVTDIPASFVADPFMIHFEEKWYLFMEIMNAETEIGEIGLVTSVDGTKWEYQQVVLKEDYHLSYPFIFRHNEVFYMIPETLNANAIRLYKARNFPYDWEYQTDLIKGKYADPTLFQHDDKWWMFTYSFELGNLNLFSSNDLIGPYTEHHKSPLIIKNKRTTRPAGKVINDNDRLIRLCQDGYPKYGSSVRAFEITKLTQSDYREVELSESPVLQKSEEKNQWNSNGMHHLDSHKITSNKWLVCVDGCYSDILNRI